MNRIQNKINELEAYINSPAFKPSSEIGQRIQQIRQEIETMQQSPALKKEKFAQIDQLKHKLYNLTERITTLQGNFFEPPTPKIRPVLASRGIDLTTLGVSANPVAMIRKEHFIPLNDLKTFLKKENLTPLNKIGPTRTSQHQLNTLSAKFSDLDLKIFFDEIGLEYAAKHKTLNKEGFKDFTIQYAKGIIEQEKKQKQLSMAGMHEEHLQKIVKALDAADIPLTPAEKGKLFMGLLKEELPREIEEKCVVYDFKELKGELESQLKQQMREYNLQHPQKPLDAEEVMAALRFLLVNNQNRFGNYLSKQEAKQLVDYLNDGLFATYKNFKLSEAVLQPYINTVQLEAEFGDVREIAQIIKKIPGYNPSEKAAVVKGGLESYREPMMIRLAENFNLGAAALQKEVAADANLTSGGAPLQVVSPFIPGITGSELDKVFKDIMGFGCDYATYKQHMEKLRTIVGPEAYGESLALSLLLHSTDDHIEQFALMGDHLVNYDMARNLPPARAMLAEPDTLYLMMRSVLIDFPQFNDPLHPEVIAKLCAITPNLIEENLKEARISEFNDPYQLCKLLRNLQPPLQEEQLQLIEKAGNRQAAMSLREDFSNVDELLKRAKRGCEYPRSVALHSLSAQRNYLVLQQEIAPFLKKAKMSLAEASKRGFKEIIPLVEKAGNKKLLEALENFTDIKPTNSELAQIEDEIGKLLKASVDEREIERMKTGQRRVIAQIEQQKGKLTGRELAEALYPEEMIFIDASRDLDTFLPSLSTNVTELMEEVRNNPKKFDPARIAKLEKAQKILYEEACEESSYKRFCVS